MSRALIVLVFALTTLGDCASSSPVPLVEKDTTECVTYPTLQQWLNLQQDVADMTSDEIVAKLVRVNKPEGAGQLFYYGLLNQQLEAYGAWTQARDAFQQLHEDGDLTVEQRQLASILQEYNQNRINWYQRQRELLIHNAELEQQLSDAEQEKLLAEQKIQALTDLEAVISTRKEQ